jgi:hypothetical protein
MGPDSSDRRMREDDVVVAALIGTDASSSRNPGAHSWKQGRVFRVLAPDRFI